MDIRSRAFERQRACAVYLVTHRFGSCGWIGAQKNDLQLLRTNSEGVVRPTAAACSRPAECRISDCSGIGSAARRVPPVWHREGNEAICWIAGVADSFDEAKAAFRRAWDAKGLAQPWVRVVKACLAWSRGTPRSPAPAFMIQPQPHADKRERQTDARREENEIFRHLLSRGFCRPLLLQAFF